MGREVMAEIKKNHINKMLAQGKRMDGRGLEEFRPLSIEINYIGTAEGSARVKLGKTDIIVGIKMSVGTPFADTPDKGVLTTNVELIPMAAHFFESGPPGADAIEIARVVDHGIRESQMVDLKALCISPGEAVWINFMDIYVVDFDGNLFDACNIGVNAALRSTIVPAAKHGKGEDFPMPVTCSPVSCTAVLIDGNIAFDPTLEEEMVANARLTVTTDESGDIRAMQKGLHGSFSSEQIKYIIDTSLALSKDVRDIIG